MKFVSKMMGYVLNNDEFCIKNNESSIKNEDFRQVLPRAAQPVSIYHFVLGYVWIELSRSDRGITLYGLCPCSSPCPPPPRGVAAPVPLPLPWTHAETAQPKAHCAVSVF